jgi:RNA polymerase sigma-70 factor (ECF subfamily)
VTTAEESDARARATADRVARESYGKLVAFLARRTGDVAAAEDALGDAFAAALAEWPVSGVPNVPEAWLVTVARRRFLDRVRRREVAEANSGALRLLADELQEAATADTAIPDDRLALMFACAHPALDPAIRAPLILQTILGFDAAAIASAFLVAPAAMSQRLVRAKKRIAQAGIPFRVPEQGELPERLDAVLAAIYATFAEGWVDAAGTDTRRRNLAAEGIWLGRLIVSLMPGEPEARGLLAMMLYAEARRPARRSASGDYVPLSEQDSTLWDSDLIDEAEDLLRTASAEGPGGRYQLEAAIQSAHVVRRVTGSADWRAIAALYGSLAEMTASPVVAINRAVAIAEVDGPAAGLGVLVRIAGDPRLAEYQPYWAAFADLSARAGNLADADAAYQRAIGLESDMAVRRFLQRKRAGLNFS